MHWLRLKNTQNITAIKGGPEFSGTYALASSQKHKEYDSHKRRTRILRNLCLGSFGSFPFVYENTDHSPSEFETQQQEIGILLKKG